jgi:hypothetical protein
MTCNGFFYVGKISNFTIPINTVMKTLVLLCFAIIASCSCYAQTDQNSTIPKGYDPKKQKYDAQASETPATPEEKFSPKRPLPVPQSTGQTYGTEEINRMARKDVNGIASTGAGVQSTPGTGSVPSIRGADPSGTAYFVDGVRAYGALPIITK